jgi:hypothetical protein
MGKQSGNADHYQIHVSTHPHEIKLHPNTKCSHSVLKYSIFTFHIDNNIEIFYCILTRVNTLHFHHIAAFLICEVLYYRRKLYSICLDNNLSHITNLLLYHFLFVTLKDGQLLRRFIQQTHKTSASLMHNPQEVSPIRPYTTATSELLCVHNSLLVRNTHVKM